MDLTTRLNVLQTVPTEQPGNRKYSRNDTRRQQVKALLRKSILIPTLVVTICVCSYSSAFSEGMTLKIEKPVRYTAWIKFTGDKIASYSIGLHTPTDGTLTADIKVRAHCEENYEVNEIQLKDTLGNTISNSFSGDDSNHRTQRHTFLNAPIATIQELKDGCKTLPDGRMYNTYLYTHIMLECKNPLEYYGMDLDGVGWKEKIFGLSIPLDVTCYLDRVRATVEDEYWTYACPETPRNNDTYWKNFRLVVEGTDSHEVRTNAPLNEPRCVSISLGDRSNMNKVIWRAD